MLTKRSRGMVQSDVRRLTASGAARERTQDATTCLLLLCSATRHKNCRFRLQLCVATLHCTAFVAAWNTKSKAHGKVARTDCSCIASLSCSSLKSICHLSGRSYVHTTYRQASYKGWKRKASYGSWSHAVVQSYKSNSNEKWMTRQAVLKKCLLLQAVFKGQGRQGLPLQACYVSPELPGLLPQSGFSRATPSLLTTTRSRSLCSKLQGQTLSREGSKAVNKYRIRTRMLHL